MGGLACRACLGQEGHLVLDLGDQPACDYFPQRDAPGPDPVYRLRMWLCANCGLGQLEADPTTPDEPKGVEPAALTAQAEDAVSLVTKAGMLPPGTRIAEYDSPHGGSWTGLLRAQGLTVLGGQTAANVVIDCFGLMHAPDQALALAERSTRVAGNGVLLLQYHSLDAIIRHRQWNALRHGHFAYYSTTAITEMLATVGFSPRTAWTFDLYGGTVLLAARRDADDHGRPDASVRALLAAEARTGVRDPGAMAVLQRGAREQTAVLHDWLVAQCAAGRTVLGYGAASRAVTLLRMAGAHGGLLAAVADASPAKHGRRMPGSMTPIISPAELVSLRPDLVLVLVPDLVPEVRAAYPEIEQNGGRWIRADALTCALGIDPGRVSGWRSGGSNMDRVKQRRSTRGSER